LIQRKNKKHYIFKIFIIFVFLFCIYSFFNFCSPSKIYCNPESNKSAIYDADININAESAVIINYDTGDILWEKNSSVSLYPASLTKMLSSIVAIENIGDFFEITEITKKASGRNHSSFKFNTGDDVSLMDLLKASLISSHNNAIIALAEYVSGDTEDFVDLMNTKTKEIGAENTNLESINGLDDVYQSHKSTALDLAKIASYCMKNDLFSKIVSTEEDIIKINNKEIEITNTNNLLEYDYIKGIKTGYTDNAGFCIALYSVKEDLRLITVVLNDGSLEERNSDALKLLDWAYGNLKYTKIVDSKEPAASVTTEKETNVGIDLYPQSDYISILNTSEDKIDFQNNINKDITLPVKKNEVLGKMAIFVNDSKVKEINLISMESIESDFIYQEISTGEDKKTVITIISVVVFYFLIFIIIIVKNLLSKRVL
jgi:serine-type D-Ala-D-Ala carboxypeptidase (penicillin-binding protein 5/6)